MTKNSDDRRAIELAALRKREELERRRQELERIALQKRQEILDALKIKVWYRNGRKLQNSSHIPFIFFVVLICYFSTT